MVPRTSLPLLLALGVFPTWDGSAFRPWSEAGWSVPVVVNGVNYSRGRVGIFLNGRRVA